MKIISAQYRPQCTPIQSASSSNYNPSLQSEGKRFPFNPALKAHLLFSAQKRIRNNPNSPILAQGAAVTQSQTFQQKGMLFANEKILDGFRLTDADLTFDLQGIPDDTPWGNEILVVDRHQDRVLRKVCHWAAGLQKLPEEERAQKISQYVRDVFTRMPWEKRDQALSKVTGTWVYLGRMMSSGVGECRHMGLLFKILADEAGLKATVERGIFCSPLGNQDHLWSRVRIDGVWHLYDIAQKSYFPLNEEPDNHIKASAYKDEHFNLKYTF